MLGVSQCTLSMSKLYQKNKWYDRNGRNDRNDIYQWYTVDLETESDLQQEHPAKSWGYRPQSWRSTPNTQPWCWSRCMDWRQRQTRSPHENIGSINAHWCPPIISNNPVDLQWDTPAQWLLSCLIFFCASKSFWFRWASLKIGYPKNPQIPMVYLSLSVCHHSVAITWGSHFWNQKCQKIPYLHLRDCHGTTLQRLRGWMRSLSPNHWFIGLIQINESATKCMQTLWPKQPT